MTTQKKLTITTDGGDTELSYTHKSEEYITSIKFMETCLEAYRANGYVNDVEVSIHVGCIKTVNLSFSDGLIDSSEERTDTDVPTLSNLTHHDWGMGRRD